VASDVDPLAELSRAGVAVWLDDLSRDRLTSGSLRQLVQNGHVVGLTSNPTIFANAIGRGIAYDAQIRDLAMRAVSVGEALRMMTTLDVRWACDVFRPTFEATDGMDGRVSIEVDPRLADDVETTVAEARQLWWLVDRPNLFIKIPATRAGLGAISRCLAEGISVNVTLIFSLARYAEVMEAYLEGMERALANGHDVNSLTSVAPFFVSRVDTEVDKRLDAIGTREAEALKGSAGVANARLAYRLHEQTFGSERAQSLSRAGARPQRPLWASTGVKNPLYPDTMYVSELVADGVVNTMPESTLRAVADHAVIQPDSIRPSLDAARKVLADLAAVGVDYDEVVSLLEDEGVHKFEASWAAVEIELGNQMQALRQ
jgi:transaldolase